MTLIGSLNIRWGADWYIRWFSDFLSSIKSIKDSEIKVKSNQIKSESWFIKSEIKSYDCQHQRQAQKTRLRRTARVWLREETRLRSTWSELIRPIIAWSYVAWVHQYCGIPASILRTNFVPFSKPSACEHSCFMHQFHLSRLDVE